MEIEKVLRFAPRLPGTNKFLLHTVVVLHNRHHIKRHTWPPEGWQNAQKQIILLAHQIN